MSLVFAFADGHSMCHYGCTVCPVLPAGVTPSTEFRNTLAFHDELYLLLSTKHFFVPVGFSSAPALFGYQSSGETIIREFSNPVESLSEHSALQYDSTFYRSFLDNVRAAGNLLTGEHMFNMPPAREKFARHATYSGSLIRSSPSFYPATKNATYAYHGGTAQIHYTGNKFCHWGTVQSAIPLGISLRVDSWANFWSYNVLDLLDSIKITGMRHVVNHQYGYWERKISNLSYDLNDAGLEIRYSFYVYFLDTYPGKDCREDTATCRVKIFIPTRVPDFSRQPVVGQGQVTVDAGSARYSWYDASRTCFPVTGGSGSVSTDPYTSSHLLILSQPALPNWTDREDGFGVINDIVSDRTLERFRFAVDHSWSDIIPASLFSSVDAFRDLEGSLNTNMLEALSELPDLASLLPDVRTALEVLSDVLGKRLTAMTFKRILDVLSSTQLKHSFAWRPMIDLLTEYLPKLESTLRSVLLADDAVTGRGRFDFDFPSGSFERESTHLTARTKMVLRVGSSTLSTLLGVDAVGVLPTSSRAWEMVPFSFVLDWFTGVGGYIERAETAIFMSVLPAYYVHTYTITSPFTNDELANWELRDVGVEPAALRLHYRDVSRYGPVLRDSRFDFGVPSGLPPFGTVGSLLYQLLT